MHWQPLSPCLTVVLIEAAIQLRFPVSRHRDRAEPLAATQGWSMNTGGGWSAEQEGAFS